MVFHPSKSHVLPISSSNIIDKPNKCIYSMNDTPIEYTDIEKDLGVHIHCKLDWSHHCNSLYSKANQRLGLLKRTCSFIKNMTKRRTLYLSQVRSQFEHWTIIWRPSTKTVIDKLESVQKRGLKWILNDAYISLGDNQKYFQVCKQLNILPLSVRFDYKDILFFHSIFYDISLVPFPPYLKRFSGSRLRTSHLDNLCIVSDVSPRTPQNLTSSITRHTGISKSFFYRSYLMWNQLPYELRSIERPSLFKNNLLKHLWNQHLSNGNSGYTTDCDSWYRKVHGSVSHYLKLALNYICLYCWCCPFKAVLRNPNCIYSSRLSSILIV